MEMDHINSNSKKIVKNKSNEKHGNKKVKLKFKLCASASIWLNGCVCGSVQFELLGYHKVEVIENELHHTSKFKKTNYKFV